jgi:uncharacterized protein YndB with AHSA1/START domain
VPPTGPAFAFVTDADPARIWLALTDTAQTGEYLYGLRLSSQWSPDATIEVRYRDGSCLDGRVLCSWPERRLSYLLQSPDGPPVYLTWLIRPGPAGTVCTLRIDEFDEMETPGSRTDAENTWLPVLAALQRLLAQT